MTAPKRIRRRTAQVEIVHVDVPHAPNCNNCLVVLPADFLMRRYGLPDVQHRDAIGRRHRHSWRLWLTLVCNDFGCPAVVLVRADAIGQLAMDNGGLRPSSDITTEEGN